MLQTLMLSTVSRSANTLCFFASKQQLQRATLATCTRQIRGAYPSYIQVDNNTFNENIMHHSNANKRIYTVRPVAFWMDKILEKENKKTLLGAASAQDVPTAVVEKTMSDSYMEEYLPFKSSPGLLDEYITTGGKIRFGKIFEDLDALAGAISYKHMDTFNDNSPPLTAVTASVDRMELLMPNSVSDLKLSGHVAYVGKSSMEVFIKMETVSKYDPAQIRASSFPPADFITQPTPNTVLFARFTMVAVDSATGKSARVNPLVICNEKEEQITSYAASCKARKRLTGEASLSKVPPTAEEQLTLHNIYMENDKHKKISPEHANAAWMEDMKMQSVLLMQPQDRNIHNKVFGGYLMRRAFELAHAQGLLFAKSSSVNFVALDEIVFKKSVPVGSLLNLSSQVIYAQGGQHKSFQVSVTAEVITDIEAGTTDITNTFHFTFAASDANKDKPVRQILPRTYAESVLYLEGKRRRQQGVQSKKELMKLMCNDTQ